jgi:DNA polymerase III epsilon subunit-like protein
MPSTPGPHTGILREENLVHRHILGHGDQQLQTDALPHIGLPLPISSIKNLIIVPVDVDTGGGYEVISPDQSFQVGMSIFDTRCLLSNNEIDPQTAVTSYQSVNRDTEPCQKATRRLLLGATEILTTTQMAARISTLTKDRDYVLVAHGIKEDLKFLNNIDPYITARACYVLDTVKVAQHIFQLYYRYSLEKLLDALNIPYDPWRLHAAGNDAFFTLKALLGFAARDILASPQLSVPRDQQTIDTQSSLATTLETIAQHSSPSSVEEPQEAPRPEKVPKLSIAAKRRLRRERKAIRRAQWAAAGVDELEQGTSHEPAGTTSTFGISYRRDHIRSHASTTSVARQRVTLSNGCHKRSSNQNFPFLYPELCMIHDSLAMLKIHFLQRSLPPLVDLLSPDLHNWSVLGIACE